MEAQCFQGIVDWMNNAATSKEYPHAPITSWFYWAYNPDSGGVGIILSHIQAAHAVVPLKFYKTVNGRASVRMVKPLGEHGTHYGAVKFSFMQQCGVFHCTIITKISLLSSLELEQTGQTTERLPANIGAPSLIGTQSCCSAPQKDCKHSCSTACLHL